MRKRQRRLDGIDQLVLSLTARGLTTGEIAAHFAEVYGARVSKDHLPDHRQGRRGDDRVVQPAAGAGQSLVIVVNRLVESVSA